MYQVTMHKKIINKSNTSVPGYRTCNTMLIKTPRTAIIYLYEPLMKNKSLWRSAEYLIFLMFLLQSLTLMKFIV